jgi:hypothetical protein
MPDKKSTGPGEKWTVGAEHDLCEDRRSHLQI